MRAPTFLRRRGDLGENAAARYLRRNGYKIRARNFTALGFELDIVAENRECVVFAEVKTRRLAPEDETGLTKPAAAVDREKQRHIIIAAKCWLAGHPSGKPCRLDVVEVYLDCRDRVLNIHHIPGAFTA